MRPIDGDSAVQQIRKFVGCHKGCSENFYYGRGCKACAWSEIIGIVENAPTIEPYGTWIPCSERLPECEWGSETGALMFQLKDSGYIEVGFFGTGSMWRDKYFRTYTNLHGYDASSVIAWMPLPEPYREEKKDE